MRARFGEAMKGTSYAGAFDLITRTVDADGATLRELPKLLADLEGIEGVTGDTAAAAAATN
jgi:hypothetical protein